MTDRRVKVTVDADYQPLIDGSGEAVVAVKAVKAEMKSLDKQIEETTRDMERLDVVIVAGKAEFLELGAGAESAKEDVAKLGTEAKGTEKSIGGLGDKSRATKADLDALDAKIKATRKSVQDLGLEFARTGSKVDGTAFNRDRSLLARLERLRKELTAGGDKNGLGRGILADAAGVAPEVEKELVAGATSAGTKAATSFATGFKDIPWGPILIGGLIEAVVLALPLIGGMVAGAVAGAIGTAGIAGGILAASKDPVVQSAFAEFGHHVSTSFFASGGDFVLPIRESLAILQADFDKLNLGAAFAKVAPLVTTIASGFGALALKFMPGFNKALDRMGPFAAAAAVGLGEIGNALGGLADDATKSHGALQGLELMFALISGSIAAIGKIILWLSDRLQDLNEFIEGVAKRLLFLFDSAGIPADSLRRFVNDLDNFNKNGAQYGMDGAALLGDAFAAAASGPEAMREAIHTLNDELDEWINKASSVNNANLDVAQGFLDLQKNLVKGKQNWSDNTQAGVDNQKMLQQQIDAIGRQRDAAVKAAGDNKAAIDAANAKYQEQVNKVLAIGAAAGDSKEKLQALAGQYNVDVFLRLHSEGASLAGLAAEKLIIAKRAHGGPVKAGQTVQVNENTPHSEYFTPNVDGYITPYGGPTNPSRTWTGGGSGGGQIVVQNSIILLDPMTGQKTRAVLVSEATSRGKSSDVVSAAYP